MALAREKSVGQAGERVERGCVSLSLQGVALQVGVKKMFAALPGRRLALLTCLC